MENETRTNKKGNWEAFSVCKLPQSNKKKKKEKYFFHLLGLLQIRFLLLVKKVKIKKELYEHVTCYLDVVEKLNGSFENLLWVTWNIFFLTLIQTYVFAIFHLMSLHLISHFLITTWFCSFSHAWLPRGRCHFSLKGFWI